MRGGPGLTQGGLLAGARQSGRVAAYPVQPRPVGRQGPRLEHSPPLVVAEFEAEAVPGLGGPTSPPAEQWAARLVVRVALPADAPAVVGDLEGAARFVALGSFVRLSWDVAVEAQSPDVAISPGRERAPLCGWRAKSAELQRAQDDGPGPRLRRCCQPRAAKHQTAHEVARQHRCVGYPSSEDVTQFRTTAFRGVPSGRGQSHVDWIPRLRVDRASHSSLVRPSRSRCLAPSVKVAITTPATVVNLSTLETGRDEATVLKDRSLACLTRTLSTPSLYLTRFIAP